MARATKTRAKSTKRKTPGRARNKPSTSGADGVADDSVAALTGLGFTGLEAAVYTVLLRESPITSYRVAQVLGKAAANVYKAIESLEYKGAVTVDDGEIRVCRPVPPAELLRQIERRFKDQCTRAEQALSSLEAPVADERVYQLKSAQQVVERARTMLGRATTVVLLDIFPDALDLLAPDIEAAAKRGPKVLVKAYKPCKIKGADVIVTPYGEQIIENWPGQWVNLVSDASEYLLAFFGTGMEEVHQAVWTGSPYLAYLYHSGLASELIVDRLMAEMSDGPANKKLMGVINRYRKAMFMPKLPGIVSLAERFGRGDD